VIDDPSIDTSTRLEEVQKIKELRADGATVPDIMRRMKLSKASVYRALNA
jgi:hypothetical protein